MDSLGTDVVLAALLRPRLGAARARGLGRRILDAAGDLVRLSRMTPRELHQRLGEHKPLGRDGSVALAAAFELGRRAARVPLPSGCVVRGMSDLEPHLRGLLADHPRERFVVVLLDARNRPMRTECVSEGCLTWSVVHPREVFALAVRETAAAVIVAHNHPSGDPAPSPQDLEVTDRLVRAGETLGIPLLDHIIVGRKRCASLRAEGYMKSARTE